MDIKVKSIAEALHPRACSVAELLASRLDNAGVWTGFTASEGLDGELAFNDLLRFRRRSEPLAVLVFRTPQITDATEVDWGEAEVKRNDTEVHRGSDYINQPIEVVHKIKHTWSKTRSLLEQVNAGLEAGIKVGAEVGSQGGIHGITAKAYAEITAKITAGYLRKWGEDSTVTLEDERQITVQGPIKIDYEFSRSVASLARTIRTSCDYSHSVELIDERMGIAPDGRPAIQEVSPTWTEFKAVLQGFAAANRTTDWGIEPTAFYSEFISNPLRGEPFEQLTKPVEAVVELVVPYDRVTNHDFRVL